MWPHSLQAAGGDLLDIRGGCIRWRPSIFASHFTGCVGDEVAVCLSEIEVTYQSGRVISFPSLDGKLAWGAGLGSDLVLRLGNSWCWWATAEHGARTDVL